MSLSIETVNGSTRYCRSRSTKRDELQVALAELYQAPGSTVLIYPSGMAAISSVFQVLGREKNPNFLLGDELYSDTAKVLKYFNLPVHRVDVRKQADLVRLFTEQPPTCFYVETATNPSGQMFDFSWWPTLKQLAPDCLLVVDNTWTSAANFNPLLHGADLVVESMTKYISAGSCIGGMALTKSPGLATKLIDHLCVMGQFVGADHCQLFLTGLATLEARIKAAAQTTQLVAQVVETWPQVNRVMYPGLPSHPTHHLSSLLTYGPGCFWFHLTGSWTKLREARSWLEEKCRQVGLPYETSFGSAHTKIDAWPELGRSCLYDLTSETRPVVAGLWIRVSLGYESNPEEVLDQLNQLVTDI